MSSSNAQIHDWLLISIIYSSALFSPRFGKFMSVMNSPSTTALLLFYIKKLVIIFNIVNFADAGQSKNPNYKTALCQNYMSGLYCSFADKCVYAHGKHELREKPASVPPGRDLVIAQDFKSFMMNKS